VRCASCKHSWFQEGVSVETPDTRSEAPVAVEAPRVETPVADTPPPVEQPLPVEPAAPSYDAFDHAPPFRARRNPAKRATVAALAAGVVMLAAFGGIVYSGAPGLARDLFQPNAGTPLKIVSKPIDQHVFNGNEIFAVSGTVLNPTDSPQPVPDIRADLRDSQRRIVFSWMIRPEANTLAPRGKLEFNSAKLDVPVNAKELVLSLSGETAR
jgi:hypothetical protein